MQQRKCKIAYFSRKGKDFISLLRTIERGLVDNKHCREEISFDEAEEKIVSSDIWTNWIWNRKQTVIGGYLSILYHLLASSTISSKNGQFIQIDLRGQYYIFLFFRLRNLVFGLNHIVWTVLLGFPCVELIYTHFIAVAQYSHHSCTPSLSVVFCITSWCTIGEECAQ